VGLAVALGGAEAWAAPCSAPTPACHLENGTELLTSDPKRAAEELLASYQLDERTDTLALYATALALDHRYAHALDTWKRVIVFRDSELEAAREAARTSTGRKRAAARAAAARAQKQSEQAAEAIIQLWSRVGRVRIRGVPGQAIAVSRDGAPVDPAQDVIVNAGRDELVFTRKDGSVERVAVEVAAGAFVKIDAPAGAPVAVAASAARPAAPREAGVATSAKPNTPPGPAVGASAKSAGAPDAAIATGKPRSADAPVASAKPAAPVEPGAEGDDPATAPRPSVATARGVNEPRDATRGGVNGPALPVQRGREGPLPIDSRSLMLSRIGIGLAAAAVVAGGVAGSFGYLASRDFDRARDAGCSGDGRCPFGPAADLAQQSNHRARIAQISAASAAALAATGATLWWFGHTQAHRTVTDVALGVGPSSSPGGLSAALSGRF
jgi:hypothetical protein